MIKTVHQKKFLIFVDKYVTLKAKTSRKYEIWDTILTGIGALQAID